MSEGYAVGHIDDMGEGYGFRKVRRAVGVTEFGVNAIVMPARFSAGYHYHETQQELYFLHQGQMEIEFGDGTRHALRPGSVARVDAATVRRLHNTGDEDAVILVVGAEGGYVGRDAHLPEGETSRTGT
jgi:uncharacterized cupin superfamily protein